MRLDVHTAIARDRPGRAGLGARGPSGLPPFFAGMTPAARSALEEALAEPGGLILVSGPPGSGRAATLRGLMRARPDSVAVGDMGASESCAAALQAARGRLVLATSTAGDSIAAMGRIAALGASPFSIACVLRLVLAQRLADRLCPSCRAPIQPPNAVTAPLGLEPGTVVYRASGCDLCGGQGSAGPIGVFEALPVGPDVGRMIICGADPSAIANHVFRTWPNLAAAVRALVVKGLTTAEEGIALLKPQRQ